MCKSGYSTKDREIWRTDLLRKSPYSFRIQENMDQKKRRIWTLFTQCRSHLLKKCFMENFIFFEVGVFVQKNCAQVSGSNPFLHRFLIRNLNRYAHFWSNCYYNMEIIVLLFNIITKYFVEFTIVSISLGYFSVENSKVLVES